MHAVVVPSLVQVMDDASMRVQAHAAAAAINFCEHCERSTLQPYLLPMLGKLTSLLQRNIRRVQEQVRSRSDASLSKFSDQSTLNDAILASSFMMF